MTKVKKWVDTHKIYIGKWFWTNRVCWRSKILVHLIALESHKYDKGGWGFTYHTWRHTAKRSEDEALLKACGIYGVDYKQFEDIRKKSGLLPWRDLKNG